MAGDGCGAACTVEPGYACAGGSPDAADTCVGCHASCATCDGAAYGDCTSCATAYPFANTLEGCGMDSVVQACRHCLEP